jgi:hypothetical protein
MGWHDDEFGAFELSRNVRPGDGIVGSTLTRVCGALVE